MSGGIKTFFRRLLGKPIHDSSDDQADWLRAIEQDGFITVHPSFVEKLNLNPLHDDGGTSDA